MRKRIIGAVVLAMSGVLVLTVLNVNFLVRRNKDSTIRPFPPPPFCALRIFK